MKGLIGLFVQQHVTGARGSAAFFHPTRQLPRCILYTKLSSPIGTEISQHVCCSLPQVLAFVPICPLGCPDLHLFPSMHNIAVQHSLHLQFVCACSICVQDDIPSLKHSFCIRLPINPTNGSRSWRPSFRQLRRQPIEAQCLGVAPLHYTSPLLPLCIVSIGTNFFSKINLVSFYVRPLVIDFCFMSTWRARAASRFW